MLRSPVWIVLSLLVSSKLCSQVDINADTTKRIFEKVDVEASFPGGEQEWRKFLERNLNPSVPVDNG
ncbi:MAG TPA: hypothetical protein VFD56_11460, partial [Chitinophagaceae bacterium]|nr:hypothetical protein [Chitinophagaceae bacterium]